MKSKFTRNQKFEAVLMLERLFAFYEDIYFTNYMNVQERESTGSTKHILWRAMYDLKMELGICPSRFGLADAITGKEKK